MKVTNNNSDFISIEMYSIFLLFKYMQFNNPFQIIQNHDISRYRLLQLLPCTQLCICMWRTILAGSNVVPSSCCCIVSCYTSASSNKINDVLVPSLIHFLSPNLGVLLYLLYLVNHVYIMWKWWWSGGNLKEARILYYCVQWNCVV